MELGTFTTVLDDGAEVLASLTGLIPVAERVGIRPILAGHRRPTGDLLARDALLLVPVRLVETPTSRVTISPGLNVPIGSIGAGTRFTPLSSGSVDPWLSVDAIAGGSWLGSASLAVRTPLYAGVDGVTQGAFVRGSVRGARRIGTGGAAWVGVSPVVGLADTAGRGGFAEVAATAGGTIPLSTTWALTPRLRVPMWQVTSDYTVSLGLALSAVLGGGSVEETAD